MIALACLLGLGACKEKKTTDDIIVSRQETPKPQAPIRMQEYRQATDVDWKGAKYHVEIVRTPVDSLPMVKDEIGQQYIDNRILVVVTRPDSTVFFRKSFSKSSFAPYLDDDYRKTGILEAMIFEQVADGRLEFAVSVAHPQSEDEFIPLTMKVEQDGSVTIKRDENMDTFGNEQDSEDDGV